ncbi:MAG: DUF1549 domain-containing protein, partial [Planctomycetaceae bacterium]|nr:DUF1549 domain-containing protein [Planctomycetaceae bacterium]
MIRSLALVTCWSTAFLTDSLAGELDYSRDIRPILSENCLRCHGPDDKTRQGGLRLDTFAGATAMADTGVAIVPQQPDASGLVQRITSADVDLRMPPADSGKTLTPDQIALLQQWIAEGAEYTEHWAFREVVRPDVPQLDADFVRNPIDQFVLAQLQEHGLQPSAPAENTTLIRRVSLDLTGLPPALDQLDAFLADETPDAYERMVDQLLASPHYGERWGRHWLDHARYADTNGYTIDGERSIWPYRDWVIQAFNDDMPFDQFTIEQLAGDLLPAATSSQLIATGFHRNTLVNQEGGTDAEQFRNEAVVDRVNTTGAVWLGLTIGCAQCHSHKYDPIS